MRLPALILFLLPLAGCSSVESEKTHPFQEPNQLMRQEIRSRIAQIPFQHGQELLDNLLWLSGKAKEQAIPDLLPALKSDQAKVRSSAAWVLGRIRDRRTVEYLRPLATDHSESVRLEAARSLVLMGDMQHVPTLIEGLDSDKVPVRYNCHMALKDATNRDFEYDHLAEADQGRTRAVHRWWKWWSKQSGDLWFAEKYAKEHNLKAEEPTPEIQIGDQTGNVATPPTPPTPMVETEPGDQDREKKGQEQKGTEEKGEVKKGVTPEPEPVPLPDPKPQPKPKVGGDPTPMPMPEPLPEPKTEKKSEQPPVPPFPVPEPDPQPKK